MKYNIRSQDSAMEENIMIKVIEIRILVLIFYEI